MINTVKDLMIELKDNGISEIEEYLSIKHGPTIGTMYEGLTKDIIDKAIFKDLDLRVCSGFIRNSKDGQSKQIDCMIVIGSGNRIPHTYDYIYDISRVVAVIEVKKDLFAKELESAYMNLLSVKDLVLPDRDMTSDILEQAYENVTGRKLPMGNKIKELSEYEQYLYHTLVVEAYLPLRITMGYGGFATEKSFRDAFKKYIVNNSSSRKGYGITSIPSLIIAGNNSIVKTNGIPFGISSTNLENGEWVSLGTSNDTPLYYLIYLIWTRLYYLFPELPESIFDNTDKKLNPLLRCRASSKGWEYTFIDCKLCTTIEKDWEPVEISPMSDALLILIHNGTQVVIDNEEIDDVCKEHGERLEDIVKDLQFKHVVYVENNVMQVLPEEWMTVMFNGKHYFGDNFNNRMVEWYRKLCNK